MTERDTSRLSDNWRFSERSQPVDEQTLEFYIATYGEERARGYLDAIADCRAEAAWMLDDWNPVTFGASRSASKTQVMLRKFKKHKQKLINYALSQPVVKSDKPLMLKMKQM